MQRTITRSWNRPQWMSRPHKAPRNAWIGHVSYAKVAGIATFNGRYVVG